MEMLGLDVTQLLILVGLGVLLIVLLGVLKAVLRLTKSCLGVGMVGILILLIVACVAMRGLAG